jgi:hypothetical protein
MRRQRTLLIFGLLAISLGLVLTRIAATPDFLSGLVFGIGAGILFLLVWKNGGDARRSC